MKKTIIALLALAGIAGAELLTFTPQVDDEATWTKGISFSPQNGSSDLSLTFVSITEWHDASYTANTEVDKFTGASGLSPMVQFQETKNGHNSWTLTFTVTNNSDKAITLGGFSTTAYAVKPDGTDHAAGINRVWTAVYDSTDKLLGEGYSVLNSGGVAATTSITFSEELVIDSENTQTFSFKFDRRLNEGGYSGYVNVSSIGVKVVPEPATATLSLLALAGLAARRRRK